MTPVEVLIKARERLEKGWCRFTMAKDSKDRCVDVCSNKATSYCILGAIVAETLGDGGLRLESISLLKLPEMASQWNDRPRRTHQQVLNKFDAAIKRAKKATE